MQYTETLISKAKYLYPRWEKLHELLEKGSPCVLGLLNQNQPATAIPIATILNAETLDEIHTLANLELEKSEFYLEVIAFVESYRKEKNARVLKDIQSAHERGERLT